MEQHRERDAVLDQPDRAIVGRPPRHHGEDSDVYRISNTAIDAPDDEPGGRIDWRGRAAPRDREIPEAPEVDRGADEEQRSGDEQSSDAGRRDRTPRPDDVGQVAGHGPRHEDGKDE